MGRHVPLKIKATKKKGQRKIHIHAPGSIDYSTQELISPERQISTAIKPHASETTLTGTYLNTSKHAANNQANEVADFEIVVNQVRQPFYSKY